MLKNINHAVAAKGSGIICLRRGVRGFLNTNGTPFEHNSQEEARKEAARIAEKTGKPVAILMEVETVLPPRAWDGAGDI